MAPPHTWGGGGGFVSASPPEAAESVTDAGLEALLACV